MKKINKIIILILTSLLLASCGRNVEQKERNTAFIEKYSCTENKVNTKYTCEKLDNLSIYKTLFKVYNDKYFKDKNALYKIGEDKKAIMLDVEIRKLNDIENAFDLDEESFEIVSSKTEKDEYIKDKENIYKLYNYKNTPAKKVEAIVNNDGFLEIITK